MDWEDVRYFVAVARAGTATGAARAVNASPSTVIKRIGDLEKALGHLLFDRSRAGYALTEFGQAVLGRAEPFELAAHDIVRLAEGAPTRPTGRVRVSTTESLATWWLVPRLSAFQERHPGLNVELLAGSEVLSLTRRETDIALRLARPEGGDLLVRRVGDVGFAGYQRRGGGENGWLCFHEQPAQSAIARFPESRLKGREPVLRASDFATHQVAARAGLGCALLPCFMGEIDPDLERVTPGAPELVLGLWLVVHRDLRSNPRVKAMIDFLVDLTHSTRQELAGKV